MEFDPNAPISEDIHAKTIAQVPDIKTNIINNAPGNGLIIDQLSNVVSTSPQGTKTETISLPKQPGKTLADITKITDDEIILIRRLMDDISWTLFDISTRDTKTILRIQYVNLYLIESFNWFAVHGLRTFFENKEIVFPNIGILKIVDYSLERPRAEDLSRPEDLLYPQEARNGRISYTGTLMISTILKSSTGRKTYLTGDKKAAFGKIPIMLGSQFDNLSDVRTEEELKLLGEDPKDFMGYFIVGGYRKVLITQNYLASNKPICISASKGSEYKTTSQIRSRGADLSIAQLETFIMNSGKARLRSSDKRIYVKLPFIDTNVYDTGTGATSAIGINIISIFRLGKILLHTLNPIQESLAYLPADMPSVVNPIGIVLIPPRTAGYRNISTYEDARSTFEKLLRLHAGDKLWPKIADYYEDTIIEASLEANEMVFWQATITASGIKEIHGGASIAERADPVLTLFANQFLPHCSNKAIPIQTRKMKNTIYKVRLEIQAMHDKFIAGNNESIRANARNIENEIRKYLPGLAIPELVLPGINDDPEFVRQREINISLSWLNNLLTAPNLDPKLAQLVSSLLYYRRGVLFNKEVAPKLYKAYLEFETMKRDMDSKFNVLVSMVVKVLRVELGFDTLDDRDTLANQKFENPGLLLMSRFVAMFRKIEKLLIKNVKTSEDIMIKMSGFADKIITQEYDANFRSGMWNDKIATKNRTGVTDNLPVVTIAKVSYLRRVSAQSNDYNSDTSSREITGLQGGAICISETPEGKRCGNVEHLAYAAFITNETFDRETLAYKLFKLKTSRRYEIQELKIDDIGKTLEKVNGEIMRKLENGQNPSQKEILQNQILGQMKNDEYENVSVIQSTRNELNGLAAIGLISNTKRITPSKETTRDTPLYLNGKFIGFVEGLSFRRLLINMRRYGTIHPHTGIHYSQRVMKGVGLVKDLRIDTTGGRIVQPLIVAEDPIKTVNFLYNLINEDPNISTKTIEDFIAEGLIEFIDSAELEFLDVALSVDVYLKSIQEGLPERYDHIMLNPAFLLGAAANVMPFAGNNPVVRNSYFTAMVKQPITVPSSTYHEENAGEYARLHDPQLPLIKTRMYDQLLEDDPFGVNLKVLVTPHIAGEEDGIIVSQEFVDMGGLASTNYKTFMMGVEEGRELDFGEEFIEDIKAKGLDPDRYGRGVIRVKKKEFVKYTKPDGTTGTRIVEVPIRVRPHDILARKTYVKGENKQSIDLIYDSLREGIVDRVMWKEGKDRVKWLSVVIRWSDEIDMGDKIASRFSQKGIGALVVPKIDLPFDENGNTPDILLNPQGLPSRMTIGQMMELLVTEAFILPDRNKNIFSVYRNQGLEVLAPLERIFIVDKQEWERFKFDDSGSNRGYATYEKVPVEVVDEIPTFSQFAQGMQPPVNLRPVGLTSNLSELAANFAANVKQTEKPPIQKSEKPEYIIITSDEIYDQDSMNFLKEHDVAQNSQGFENGLWAISFYKQLKSVTVKNYILVLNPNADFRDIDLIIPINWRNNILSSFSVSQDQLEEIPGLYFDIERDENDEEVNPMRGIRISRISDKKINPIKGIVGDSLREIYIRGNVKTPIPDQFIIDYRKDFFKAGNLISFYFNFRIPEEFKILRDFVLSNDRNDEILSRLAPNIIKEDDLNRIKDKFLIEIGNDIFAYDDLGKLLMVIDKTKGKRNAIPEDLKILDTLPLQSARFTENTYNDLRKLKTKYLIREAGVFVYDENKRVVSTTDPVTGEKILQTQTAYESLRAQDLWSRRTKFLVIPRENVINLPEKAVDIYINRKERLNALREATIFKKDIDINDAMKELELMGYNRDGSRVFYHPKTGKQIKGELVTGYSYYMALGHKVKNKLQGRGQGKMNPLTRQPNSGRTREGGLRFNYMDALAVIKSGASAFVSDRLLDASSKTEVYVCQTHGIDCYQKTKDTNKSIICPICKDETKATKISLPYVSILDRNLLMGAGVRLKMNISQPPQDEQ